MTEFTFEAVAKGFIVKENDKIIGKIRNYEDGRYYSSIPYEYKPPPRGLWVQFTRFIALGRSKK